MEQSKIKNFLAQAFSYIFNPLVMATFAVIIFFNSGHFFSIINQEIKSTIYFIFFILTFLSPALFIPLLNYFRLSSKREISSKTIKIISLIIVGILYMIVYYYMGKIMMPKILLNVVISFVALIIFNIIILLFWNISIFTSGIGGLAGFVFYLMNYLDLPVFLIFSLVIIIAGIVASARLYLNKHNPLQVYAGLLSGFIIIYSCMIIF